MNTGRGPAAGADRAGVDRPESFPRAMEAPTREFRSAPTVSALGDEVGAADRTGGATADARARPASGAFSGEHALTSALASPSTTSEERFVLETIMSPR